MKRTSSIFCLICILLLSMGACSERVNKDLLYTLADIQAMGDSCPEKALVRLDSIRPSFEEEPEYMRKKFALLDIRLHDKAFITHTSDSTIKDVCGYFKEYGSARELQEAYYYMGSVYRDLKDSPRAVTYYLKAIETAEKSENTDPKILEVSYIQLAGMYREQFNYTEGLNMILKGLDVAEKYGFANERTYMNVADSYWKINDKSNCLLFCNKAMSIIEKKGINKDNADLVSKAMSSYTITDCNEDAKKCFIMLSRIKEDERPGNYLSTLSKYYKKYVSNDSAAIIVRNIFESTADIKELYDASKWLTVYYTKKGDLENAILHATTFIRVSNTIIKNRDIESTDKAKNIYQYQRDKEEETALIESTANSKILLITGVFMSVIVVLLIFVIYNHRKKKLLGIIVKKEDKIKETNFIITQKQKELAILIQKNDELQKLLRDAEKGLKMLVEQNSKLTRENIMTHASRSYKDILNKAMNAAQGKENFDENDWKALLATIDREYPEFTQEVQEKFKKISEPMLRVCYLHKLGLSNPQISGITGYPPQTVWDRVKRIEKVLESTKGQ